MSKPTVSATGGAMPAEGPKTDDAELLAMEVEIMRLSGLAKAIHANKVDPFEKQFAARLRQSGYDAALAFADTYGREDAIEEAETFSEPAARLCERLIATPALTQAGRRAKVRVLLTEILPGADEWRGPEQELNWDIAQVRALFGEFAGMSAEELANV
jgi:hypothetical protein